MIGRIAFAHSAFITRTIVGIPWRKRTQTQRRKQLTLHRLHHGVFFLRWQHAVMQTHRENLIRTDGRIGILAVYHVIQTARRFIPKLCIETLARCFGVAA